jgi:hypothetical protein
MSVEVAFRLAFVQIVQHGGLVAASKRPSTFRTTKVGGGSGLVVVPYESSHIAAKLRINDILSN